MRKRNISLTSTLVHVEPTVDLEADATVEVTSEDKGFQIESALSALSPEHTRGWRASEPGTQKVRLLFDQPHQLTHISLVFDEED